jgi:hypothetical protein
MVLGDSLVPDYADSAAAGKELDDSREEGVAGLMGDMAVLGSYVEEDRVEDGTALEDKEVAVRCSSLAEEEAEPEDIGSQAVAVHIRDDAGEHDAG